MLKLWICRYIYRWRCSICCPSLINIIYIYIHIHILVFFVCMCNTQETSNHCWDGKCEATNRQTWPSHDVQVHVCNTWTHIITHFSNLVCHVQYFLTISVTLNYVECSSVNSRLTVNVPCTFFLIYRSTNKTDISCFSNPQGTWKPSSWGKHRLIARYVFLFWTNFFRPFYSLNSNKVILHFVIS